MINAIKKAIIEMTNSTLLAYSSVKFVRYNTKCKSRDTRSIPTTFISMRNALIAYFNCFLYRLNSSVLQRTQ